MRKAHADAIRAHRLRNEIVATKVANRLVNRLGPGVAFDLTEEEGASLQQVVAAFLVAERLLDLDKLWSEIEDDDAAGNGPHRALHDRCRKRPGALVGHPPRRRWRDERRRRCASCSSPAYARFRRRRPS